MPRIRHYVILVLVGVVVLAAGGAASAVVVVPPAIPDRVAKADCIVIGTVVALESDLVVVLPNRKSSQKATYQIAVLKITEGIKEAQKGKTLRVGFVAPEPKGGIRPSGPRFGATFKVGQGGLFFLSRHFQEPFFLVPTLFAYVPESLAGSKNANFGQEVALTRFAQKMGSKLAAGLESTEAQERFYAAALLIQRYRTARGGKTELVAARESQLILTALAEADWTQAGPLNPWNLFNQLGLTAKDGWAPPSDATVTGLTAAAAHIDQHKAARTWLREHAATYRLVRRLAEPVAKRPR